MCRRSPGEVAAFTVVDDNRMLLAGRPAAASMSNSKPSVLGARVATWPLCSWATDVLRQQEPGVLERDLDGEVIGTSRQDGGEPLTGQ